MRTKESIAKEVYDLYSEGVELASCFMNRDNELEFPIKYQMWYTKSLRVVKVLAPDRLQEFKSYYEIDPNRKRIEYGTYVIQDYLKGVVPNRYMLPNFDTHSQVGQCFSNQLAIFNALSERVNSVLSSIDAQLLSELQDAELKTAINLLRVSIRAAGSLAGVVVENYLQKLIKTNVITIRKKHPTIGDMNEHLKNAGVIDTPTWRKIAYLADIRNICSHKKDVEPTEKQVSELIDGANWLIKNIF